MKETPPVDRITVSYQAQTSVRREPASRLLAVASETPGVFLVWTGALQDLLELRREQAANQLEAKALDAYARLEASL